MKKIGSILVLAVFLMTLIPTISAFATEPTIYTEDFSGNWGTEKNFGTSLNDTTSQIFTNGGETKAYYSSATGYDGTENSALAFVNSGTTEVKPYFNMKPYKTLGLSADTKLVFNMRFKPQGNPSSCNFKLQFNHGNDSNGFLDVYGRQSDGKWYLIKNNNNSGGDPAVFIDANKWYGLSVTLSTYEKDSKTYISTEVNVYDNEGNLIKTNTAKSDPELDDSRRMFIQAYGVVNGVSIVLDDAKLYSVSKDAVYLGGNIQDGEDDVIRNKVIELGFTEPVSNLVVSGNGITADDYIVEEAGFSNKRIKFKNLLGKNATYTIDLSGAGIENITFTTKAQYILDAECYAEVDTENSKKLNVTYTFNEDSGIEKIGCRMMGVLYKDGQMIDVASLDITPTAANVNTPESAVLTFNKDINGTEVSIVFFESGAYIPMSTGIACN